MQVYSINGYGNLSGKNFSTSSISGKPPVVGTITTKRLNLYNISFGSRNMNQILEYTPECSGLGLPEASLGGEGVVGFELGESLNEHEKIKGKPVDDRHVMPIWNYDNPKGGHKFLIHRGVSFKDLYVLPDTFPAKLFISANPGETKEEVARRLKLKSLDDIDYVVQSKPNGSGPEAQSKYCIIEPTSAKGTVKVPSTTGQLGEMKVLPYQLMRISEKNPKYNKFKTRSHNYFLYTPELARTSKPYSYDCWGNTPFEAEITSSNGMRALAKITANQMDTEEFGYFKPASFIAHDRPASTFMNHIANMSNGGNREVNGIKIHKVEHNPSYDYQGRTKDPFKMLEVVADERDMEVLRNHPDYEIINKAFKNGFDSLTDNEKQIARNVIEPFVAPFKDYFGDYNITKIPIVGVKRNPRNMSLGSVSWHFDAEMKSPDTPDAAKGLTGDYASIPTKPVANGVTIKNLAFDKQDAQFGRGNNGLSAPENLKNFTPFSYDGTNIKEVLAAKEKNAHWLTDLIWKAGEKGQKELNKLFFNEGQIAEGQKVMGYLSPLKDGEIIILGLGRPDTQKGFPISTGAALHFFKRKDVPDEMKSKVKFIFGAGKWNENHPHYQAIVRDLKELVKLDGGKYKHNMMYIDGFTPNRMNACTHFGSYTSEYEMFGITPIEAKAAGSPSSVTATGGFMDYTKDGINGFTTKDVVMGKPETYGLTYNDSPEAIEKARIEHQIPQVSDNYKRMIELYTNDHDGYVEMCKKNIDEKVDWHNNSAYNHGKSANRRYLDDIFETEKGWRARSKKAMRRLVGEFGSLKENIEIAARTTKSRPVKIILGVALGVIAAGTGAYMYIRQRKKTATTVATNPINDPKASIATKTPKETSKAA
ncbi:MAG: glycosyltransferase [Cyanobacteriota bacterium]|nr:glycosyltransferase [Cyanobacteriota bacterium]